MTSNIFSLTWILAYLPGGRARATLCTSAFSAAAARYGYDKDAILHSARGRQFTSHLYRQTLDSKGFRQSMGCTGSCYDNARMESFFATLKKELVYRIPTYKLSRQQMKSIIFEWIEGYCNTRRRHTANDANLPPLKKRNAFYCEKMAA